jgi:hypothetical protein
MGLFLQTLIAKGQATGFAVMALFLKDAGNGDFR